MRRLVLLAVCLFMVINASGYVWNVCCGCDAGAGCRDSAEIEAGQDTYARYRTLTDADYEAVAKELDIEPAVIRAVVLVEAGVELQGFCSPGVPVINFDLPMFRSFATRHGVKLSRYLKSHAVVFASPNTARYGSYQAAQWARYDAARTIDSVAAVQGTFWGMFQIGGFNWRNCQCASMDEFVMKMGRSERDQLDLFAAFIKSCGMVKSLRAHNWAAFARRYNGPSYKRRKYDVKIAKAYARFKREAKESEKGTKAK